ncbi:hypothetical protein GE061_015122 [Apolygus lucorum]|uniref:Polycystin domain-containing protein n=1 Tax=Apolygus lucorum TaxID=248454 RepID=A0A8S9XP49_APOLU|nr:hypothetical protein GE061_015122 [Apolygus lucorum]
MFQSLYAECADYYSQEIEDKDAFGLNTSAWRYLPSTDEGSHYSGLVSTYYGGGFVLNFTAYENFTRSENSATSRRKLDQNRHPISSDSSGKDDIKPGQDQPNEGNKRHGSISRRILNPETFERGQPAKLKRRKNQTENDKVEDFFPRINRTKTKRNQPHQGSADNYYSEVFRRLITNSSYNSSLAPNLSFGDTQSARDMWTFIIDVLCMVLYDKTIMNNNVYFGAPRLRQVRVRGKTCSPAPMFQSLYADCADYYSEEIEDKDTFGLNTSAWRYLPSTDEGSHYSGLVSTYYGGGFVLNFTEDENFTRSEIAQLRDENWVGFGTRVIFVEFGVFNPVTHLFCVCKVIFEFPSLRRHHSQLQLLDFEAS